MKGDGPSGSLEQKLQHWIAAQIIDEQTAIRIRTFESSVEGRSHRWLVVLAIVFGSIMVGAGVLLFVAAHWDQLSPTQRFLLVIAMIAGFHLTAGALMPRMRALGLALHGVGTVALGGGIFLAGQIFNLQEHWPGGILLWAIGAALSWTVLRDWIQGSLAAILMPAWIASEWMVRADRYRTTELRLLQFLVLMAFAYLGAVGTGRESSLRRSLTWIGGLAVIPACAVLAASWDGDRWGPTWPPSTSMRVVGFLMAFIAPLLLAWFLRGKAAIWNLGFAVWALAIGMLNQRDVAQNLLEYGLYIVGAIGLVIWGLHEGRRERINLGIAGFAITIIIFYFSTVMDKLGRSASLVAFGLLFLLGGWKLEQLRRRLVAKAAGVAA